MQEGLLLEATQGGWQPTYWVEGVPEKSIWTGLKLKGKEVWRVSAFRCGACGFLKTYARERKEGRP